MENARRAKGDTGKRGTGKHRKNARLENVRMSTMKRENALILFYLFIFNSRHKAHDTKIINRLQYNTDSNIHTIPTTIKD